MIHMHVVFKIIHVVTMMRLRVCEWTSHHGARSRRRRADADDAAARADDELARVHRPRVHRDRRRHRVRSSPTRHRCRCAHNVQRIQRTSRARSGVRVGKRRRARDGKRRRGERVRVPFVCRACDRRRRRDDDARRDSRGRGQRHRKLARLHRVRRRRRRSATAVDDGVCKSHHRRRARARATGGGWWLR